MNRPSTALIRCLDEASRLMRERLLALDATSLPIDPFYRDRYLREKVDILESSLIRSASQVRLALEGGVDLSRAVLIDHGGGTGTTGMLAKLAGVGTVIYNDIDPKFLDLARTVGRAIGAESDHYVLGELDVLIAHLRRHDLVPHALISYDVIEHIHDMDRFLDGLGSLSGGALTAVMSSGANMYSPRYLWSVLPIQRRAEKEWLARREAIVRELAPDLPAGEVARLARATRKHIRPEIERLVKRFRDAGTVDEAELAPTNRFDPYGTNTCNPDTGWWAEHLMNPWRLKGILAARGFEVQVLNGRYGSPAWPMRRLAARAINAVIGLLGPVGITVAAYYTLRARRAGLVPAAHTQAS